MQIEIRDKLDHAIASNRDRNRHPVWQQLHFAQTILRQTAQIKSKPSQCILLNVVSLREYPNWVNDQWESLSDFVDKLMSFTKDPAGFGRLSELSQMRTEHDVESLAQPFIRYYRQAFEWTQRVLATPIEFACARGRAELAQWGCCVTDGIELFAKDTLKESEEIANLLPDQRHVGRVQFILKWPSDSENVATLHWIRGVFSNIDQEGSSTGYLYLLVNPSMDGLVKVGKTQRDPKARAKELGAVTGIPTPFLLVFDLQVEDCNRAEEYVHRNLSEYRLSSNREFFRVEPSYAIRVMLEAEKVFRRNRDEVVRESIENYPFETTDEEQKLIIVDLNNFLAHKSFASRN